jgi:putative thioredoxin
MSNVKDIDTASFGQAVLQRSHEVPVVVDFWAEWCGPCRTLGPILEKVATAYSGDFDLVKVDIDANQPLAAQFGVQGIPNVIAFRNGEPVSRFTGALPEHAVRQFIDGILPTEADRTVDAARDAVLSGDEAGAEELFRQVLVTQVDHQEAGTGLAALLIARTETEEALIVLGKLGPTAEVERLQAAARVTASQDSDIPALEARVEADPADEGSRIELAQALAAKAEYEPALDHLLKVVGAKGPQMDTARQAMLDIFELVGSSHPLAVTYRRELANALF